MARSSRFSLVAIAVIAAFAVGPVASSAAAEPGPHPAVSVAKAKKKGKSKQRTRLGGKVRNAWPESGKRRPKTALTRWLARQVGPRKPLACGKRPKAARAKCARRKGRASAAAFAPLAMTAAAAKRISSGERVNIVPSGDLGGLELIRSFDIPADDPSYDRLLNWSWTYDSAVVATAFAAVGLQDQSARLLDQLAALQYKDGSIEMAFEVRSGESSSQIRAGSVAWSGIGFVDYDAQFGDRRYVDNARRAADYLLSLRNESGLVRGGPDVEWVSTQHNLITTIFLMNLAQRLDELGDPDAAAGYREAAAKLIEGIDSQLLIRDKESAHFRQGVDDDVVPLDTQAIGTIYAFFRGDGELAKQLYEFALQNFAIGKRSIKESQAKATYNMTYAAEGPFAGFRPYLGRRAPDVLWFEGTAEMRLVSTFVGESTEQLDADMNEWWAVTRKQGLAPLGADRTVTNNRYNEYHVWPTAAAGAWTVLSGASTDVEWATPPQDPQQILSLLR
jgi:hypothetical protein